MDEGRLYYYQNRQKGITLSLKRNFLWMLGSKAVSMAALFITGCMINRSLGLLGRGILAEMQTWVSLFIVIFAISIDAATYHFANKVAYDYDDKVKFVSIFLLNIIYALLATFALTFFVFCWPQRVSSKTIEFLFLLDIFLIISMLATNLAVFFQAMGNVRFSAQIGIIRAVVSTAIISVGYFLGFINIRFVIVSMIIVQVVALFIILRASLKSGLIFGHFSKDIAIGVILKGLKQHIATISTFVYTKINQLIVFRCAGEAQAGIFAVALTLAIYLMVVPETFQIALYPRVIHSNDDYEVTVRSLRLGFYVWGSIVILIMLLAKPILLIYGGSKFLPSVNVFRILLIAVWFLPVASLITPYYIKKGAFGIASFSAALLGVISIGLNILLVPKYASIGAALATAITCLAAFCMTILFLYYLSKKNPLVIFRPDFQKEVAFIRQMYLRHAK